MFINFAYRLYLTKHSAKRERETVKAKRKCHKCIIWEISNTLSLLLSITEVFIYAKVYNIICSYDIS